ncbi:MAG: DUF456 domain-containing protein [Nocardioidaceae bacterium]|nr:DUF456 domain-containing protein [Nocardioidaceae bacterium]
MTAEGEVLVGVVITIGVVGVVVPVIPGSLLVGAPIAVWAYDTNSGVGWLVLAIAIAVLVTAAVAKWWVAGRHLRAAGVPRATMVAGGLCAVVGFFVIPLVGLVIGFVAGVYIVERRRLRGHAVAWRSALAALRAGGLALLIELAGALLAAVVWLIGAAAT